MIVIAGRSLAPAHVGRTPGLCHALAVELLLGLFGFAIGGIESFGAGEPGIANVYISQFIPISLNHCKTSLNPAVYQIFVTYQESPNGRWRYR
jgi:hypothetical protein